MSKIHGLTEEQYEEFKTVIQPYVDEMVAMLLEEYNKGYVLGYREGFAAGTIEGKFEVTSKSVN